MIDRPQVGIIAEVGHRVGWGHVSRCMILHRILSRECDVTVKVLNRELWDDASLAREFAFQEPVKADVVFVDGLQLRKDLSGKISAGSIVSLSYMSDVNDIANLVIAPALGGMDVPSHFLTDVGAILCNRPRAMAGPHYSKGCPSTIGISMGGGDVEGLTPILEEALKVSGYKTLTLASHAGCQGTLSKFLGEKLREHQVDPFPYYAFSDCELVVCQGGLSAIEIALLGVPSVIRHRSDFTPAYGFLEDSGYSLRPRDTSITELVGAIGAVCQDAGRRAEMAQACCGLEAQIHEPFWMNLINKLTRAGSTP